LRADVLTSGGGSDEGQIFSKVECIRIHACGGVDQNIQKIALPVAGLCPVQLFTAQLYTLATVTLSLINLTSTAN